MKGRKALILAASVLALVAGATGAAMTSTGGDWRPVELVILLLALAIGSDLMTVSVRGVRVSGAFLAIVLAMTLLGPAPAAAIGAVSVFVIDVVVTRRPVRNVIYNLANFTTFPVVGGVLVMTLLGDVTQADESGLALPAVVVVIFMATNFLNFAVAALQNSLTGGTPFLVALRKVYWTVLPSELAAALLTAGIAYTYSRVGVEVVALLIVVLFIFQYLLRAGVQLYERGEEIAQRNDELASLQVGLLNTVLQTLSMRDAMTARHSAAVARYAREVATLMGVSARERELIHTAALLHDIGKFIFPDSILFADRKLTDEEWEIVKLHPEQGARLVRRIEGYGPVAEIIHSHHERVDGRGYPHGLGGDDIPLGARIIAAADTYDVMTSRDSYRRPVSSEAALAELKRVAGSQLDPAVVDAFVRMIVERGVAFRHGDDADFESELAFERRVQDYARPRPVAA